MWTWERVSGWLPVPVADVAAIGMDLQRLDQWHRLIRHVDGSVGDPEGTGRAVVRLGSRDVPAHWRLRQQVRTLAHLVLTDERGAPLDVDVVVAPWNAGTLVELSVAGSRFGGRPLRLTPLRRALRQSLESLATTVDQPLERAPVVPQPGGLDPGDVVPA